ncbi:hypothetical protein EVA_11078 [gut metagenome]|uniref:Uncharacterized protein n=1 Tax=gut metagenome TaxID=749906 RepID=J9CL57_9ZZZZ
MSDPKSNPLWNPSLLSSPPHQGHHSTLYPGLTDHTQEWLSPLSTRNRMGYSPLPSRGKTFQTL